MIVRSKAIVLGVAAALLVSGCTLGRSADPVVLKGSDVPGLSSVAAGDVVAFAWFQDGWEQVAVQVDERKQVEFGQVYNSAPVGFTTTVYADPGTFTGADSNPNVDADDEIALRSVDTGREAPADAGNPAGTVAGSGVKVRLTSSFGGDREAWVYLFKRSGGLSPGAGKDFVDYDFNLLSGDYKTTYELQDGPNPENSTVTTAFYSDHFSDRWLNDALRITTARSSGVDILDRAKAQFAPGNCSRSENTFNDAEGAFIANRDGPVRAIRSYIGANSGPLTQREHIFYEHREDIRTFLRVHAIPGVMDYFDYAPAASGMTYRNNLNTGGVIVNGVPDSVTAGQLTWESVDGDQGGLSIVHTTQTNISGFGSSSYYFDDSTPGSGSEFQCTGDSTAYGNSGPWITQNIPNTDPRTTPFSNLVATRTLYFEDAGNADGATRAAQAATPIGVSATSFP